MFYSLYFSCYLFSSKVAFLNLLFCSGNESVFTFISGVHKGEKKVNCHSICKWYHRSREFTSTILHCIVTCRALVHSFLSFEYITTPFR